MEHIRQKNSSELEGFIYTVVITTDWVLPLADHPSIVENPTLFEIVDTAIPDNVQYLKYI
jgi:hypothetical protein